MSKAIALLIYIGACGAASVVGVTQAWAQTAIRPDQITGTGDITWNQVGSGYQIGSTIAWRTDATTTPAFLATDATKTVELTAASPITATLPDATAIGFTDGFGFTIQTKSQPVTLNRFGSTQLINGLASIKLGPYQIVGLSSRGGNWYAAMGMPQPSTQTGANVLNDQMLWVAAASGGITLTGIGLSNSSFPGGAASGTTVGAISVTASGGSFTGALSLSGTNASSFQISGTNLQTNGVVASGTYSLNIVATQAGATGSPFTQAETITGTAGTGSGTGTCAESTAFFARTLAVLDTAHKNAYDAMICGLVSPDAIWSKLDALYIFATDTAANANLNLKSSSYPITANGSPNFTANQGYLGVDGSTTVYLNTGFNPATAGGQFALNAAHISVWNLSANAQSTHSPIGASDGTNNIFCVPRFTDDVSYCGINKSTNVTASGQSSTGSWTITRDAPTNSTLYHNGASVGSEAAAGVGIPSFNIYLLNRNDSNTPSGGAAQRIAGASIGGALTSANASAYKARVCTYLIAVGAVGSC